MATLRQPSDGAHPCPGDGERGCLEMVTGTRKRCQFCERTVWERRHAWAHGGETLMPVSTRTRFEVFGE